MTMSTELITLDLPSDLHHELYLNCQEFQLSYPDATIVVATNPKMSRLSISSYLAASLITSLISVCEK